ncbi:MAG: hypothetical protein JXN60_05455 [Lentisphaerae bacterium]|nr:hypothetical protein [Lentisphaerota bacterium]
MNATQHSLVVLLGLLCVAASGSEMEIGGYYKNFFSVVRAPDADDPTQADDFQRVRFKLEYESSPKVDFQVHFESSVIWGDTADTLSAQSETNLFDSGIVTLARPSHRPRFMDLQTVSLSESGIHWRNELDRLRLRLKSDRITLAIGRQSVSWGSSSFWSPVDVFSGFTPTEIDKDEKTGIDVIRLTIFPTYDSEIDAILEPLDRNREWRIDSNDSSAAIRFKRHIGQYDIAACGGYIAGNWIAGFDFSGYIMNAGLHGEFLGMRVNDCVTDNFAQAVIGIDYSFQAPFEPYFMIEYYFNSAGAVDVENYTSVLAKPAIQDAIWRGTTYSLGRAYAGAVIKLTLTPLVAFQNQTIVNMDDNSVREYASISASTSDNSEIIAGASIGIGSLGTEFGGWSKQQIGADFTSPDVYFIYFKVYY